MAWLDWIKGEKAQELEQKGIREVWQSGKWIDSASGWSVRACVGKSVEGYHPGLAIALPDRKESLSWGEPCRSQRAAVGVAHKAFTNWIDSRGARQPEGVVKRLPRPAPSWER